jgi:putative ABC transport system substrate-binding protein
MSNYIFQNKIQNWWTILLWIVMVSLLLSGCGASKPKVYQVGILIGSPEFSAVAEGFKAKMAELGYVEGENIVYDTQSVDQTVDPAEVKRVVEKLVADKVDLIFTTPTESAVMAKAATQDIPIVFTYAGLEGSDLVESVREPGGNITGVRFPGPEQISRRLDLLLEVAPEVERVWIGYDKNYPNTAPALETLRPLAELKGITLVEVAATEMGELEEDLTRRMAADDLGLDGVILMPDGFNHSPVGWAVISKFVKEQKIPLSGSFMYTVEQGAVIGNASDLFKSGELAAPLADKILKGVPAGTIPVVTPDDDVYINYKLAQELGLTVPEGLLNQAVQIIR